MSGDVAAVLLLALAALVAVPLWPAPTPAVRRLRPRRPAAAKVAGEARSRARWRLIPSISSSESTKKTVSSGRVAYQPVRVTKEGSPWAQVRNWVAEASPMDGYRRFAARCARAMPRSSSAFGTKPCASTKCPTPSSAMRRRISDSPSISP